MVHSHNEDKVGKNQNKVDEPMRLKPEDKLVEHKSNMKSILLQAEILNIATKTVLHEAEIRY